MELWNYRMYVSNFYNRRGSIVKKRKSPGSYLGYFNEKFNEEFNDVLSLLSNERIKTTRQRLA